MNALLHKIRKNIQQHTCNYDDSDADNITFATVALRDISSHNFIIARVSEKQPVS